jgi:hypothetical protein
MRQIVFYQAPVPKASTPPSSSFPVETGTVEMKLSVEGSVEAGPSNLFRGFVCLPLLNIVLLRNPFLLLMLKNVALA